MSLRVRIIPLTVVVASLFLMSKMVALIQGGQALSESLLVTRVDAQETPAPSAAPAATSAPEASTPAATPAAATPAQPADKPAADAKEGAKKQEASSDKKENPNVSTTPGEISDRRYTSVEVELLQKLGKRREELDNWEKNLQIKEITLNATEKRIDEKIQQVEAMKRAVSAALAEYNKIEDTEITSLVKIYENMKPADAARIFDELERPILLLIVDRMTEKKAAPILASMDPKKAKQVTVDLAEQRRLKNSSIGAAQAVASGAAPADTPIPPTAK